MPGGVNCPVPAFESVTVQPIVIDSFKGFHMSGIDGNDYIDYVGSWGPVIIGHAFDAFAFCSKIFYFLKSKYSIKLILAGEEL